MSHSLSIIGSRTEMAFTGETPWHGLGQQLTHDASIDDWKREAGMAWRILRSKVRYFADRDGATQFEWPEHHVLFRSDTKKPLAIVSDGYKVVQPGEVLEFFRELCEHNGFQMTTAGVLFSGRRYWALAHIGEDAVIGRTDKIGGYVLLATACDGTMRTIAKYTTIRVVCANTIAMALSEENDTVTISHRSVFKPDDVKKDLGLSRTRFEEFARFAGELAGVAVKANEASVLTLATVAPDFVEKATGVDPARHRLELKQLRGQLAALKDDLAEEMGRTLDSAAYKKIMHLRKDGLGADMESARDTAWGWLNSVTEYVDHHKQSKSDDNRLNNAWFGLGDDMKRRAFKYAVDLLEA